MSKNSGHLCSAAREFKQTKGTYVLGGMSALEKLLAVTIVAKLDSNASFEYSALVRKVTWVLRLVVWSNIQHNQAIRIIDNGRRSSVS